MVDLLGDATLTTERLERLSEEEVAELEGIAVDEDGTARFTVEMVDNAGAGPYEE